MTTGFQLPALLQTLPEDLRELAGQLPFHSVAAVSRQLGISRSTTYRRRQRLQEHLRQAGLEDSPKK